MGFWLVAGALTLAVSGLLAVALLRSREAENATPNQDMRIYRDQLAEIDSDVARGILTAEEAGRVRVEVSRRLLDADRTVDEVKSDVPPRYATIAITATVFAVLIGGTAGLYIFIGAPGYPDLPLAERLALAEEIHRSRMSQAEAEVQSGRVWVAPDNVDPALLHLMERLRSTVAERPDEVEGFRLLAQYEELLGNYSAAHSAQSRLIELKGDNAVADDYATLAQFLILAANGFVSPEAETALQMTLQMDPGHGPASYYTGLMLAQTGRPDLAYGIWRVLLERGPSDAPWIPPIMDHIEDAAQAAGIRYIPPAVASRQLSGPTVEDVEAAEGMDEVDRQEMIRGMVDGLAERIESEESGSPAEWSRLIRSLGVLGDTARASEFWSKAQSEFANDPEALATIRAAAVGSGVVE